MNRDGLGVCDLLHNPWNSFGTDFGPQDREPRDTGLSVIAVEFLPPSGSQEPTDAGRQRGVGQDPLGPDLFARRRILRTSPLVPIGAVCGILEPAGAPGH